MSACLSVAGATSMVLPADPIRALSRRHAADDQRPSEGPDHTEPRFCFEAHPA